MGEVLERNGWALVQPLLSSSHLGYGISSLQKDADEIDLLLSYLARKWDWDADKDKSDDTSVVIVGHSTGCQDAVWHNKHGRERERVTGLVLQGPVSDRDYAETVPQAVKMLSVAQQLLATDVPDALMPKEADYCGIGAPMTAYRYNSLVGRLGDDDMFSNDLTEAELAQALGHVQVPCLLAFSHDDEYVPANVDKEALGRRIAAAMPRGRPVFLPGDHALYSEQGQAELLQALEDFLREVAPTVPTKAEGP